MRYCWDANCCKGIEEEKKRGLASAFEDAFVGLLCAEEHGHAKEEPEAATHATTRRKQEHEQGTDDAHEDRVSECVFDVHKRTSVVLPSPLMTMRSAPGKSAKSTINKASSPCWVWPIQTLSPASSNASAVTVNSSPLLTALIP